MNGSKTGCKYYERNVLHFSEFKRHRLKERNGTNLKNFPVFPKFTFVYEIVQADSQFISFFFIFKVLKFFKILKKLDI